MSIKNPYVQYMYSYPHKTAYRPLSGVNLEDYGDRFAGEDHSLYVHIPFCESKCGYCNLFSVTGLGQEEMKRYLDAAERQIGRYARILDRAGAVFSDLTVGGGTPLLLEEKLLERVFDMSEKYMKFTERPVRIIETAPNQTSGEKMALLKERGVTRVSMGIQSFQEQELYALGRKHGGAQARKALDLVKSFGFPCVNVDFIYGIPGQTADSLLESLREAVSFEPHEIFLYPLYVKHGAGLMKAVREGMVLDPDRTFALYREASGYLRAEGYRQDSMRRFVRRRQKDSGGKIREENREFSDCGFSASLAVGCGGRSYVGNLHFCTPYAITRQGCLAELKAYLECEDHTRIRHGIFLSEEEQKRRYVIRHILILPGLDEKRYRDRFGTGVLEDFPLLVRWMEEGFLKERELSADTQRSEKDSGRTEVRERTEGPWLTLTEEGLGLSDYLGPQLISPDIRRRMEEWDCDHGESSGSLPGKFKKL